MRDLYVEQRLSTRLCGKILKVNPTTIRAWLIRAGVKTRTVSDAKRGQKPAPHTVIASVESRRRHRIEGKPIVGYKLRYDGYVDIYIPDHPAAGKSGYVREHRLVVEKRLGRYLREDEVVHHKNGKRADNRYQNLEVTSKSDHTRHHYPERPIDSATGRFLPGKRDGRKPRSRRR